MNRMLITSQSDTEEEGSNKKSSKKKKKEKFYELSKTQTASKLEAIVIKKSEKYVGLKKDYNWKQIYGGNDCLVAINSNFYFFLFFVIFF
jgi:hypothetical protein